MRKRGDGSSESFVDQYDEVKSEQDILRILDLPSGEMRATLGRHGFSPFCTITTTRRTFARDGFIIDCDLVDYGYRIVEIETQVDRRDQIKAAVTEILRFAEQHGCEAGYVRGKVIEYLRRHSPQHYQALVDAGVVITEEASRTR